MKLYHCTTYDSLRFILGQGLAAQVPYQRPNKPRGVYLSKDPFKWMWNTTRDGRYQGVILQVDVEGLELLPDFHPPGDLEHTKEFQVDYAGDFYHTHDIPTIRIIRIDVEYRPNCFTKLSRKKWPSIMAKDVPMKPESLKASGGAPG